MRTRPSTGSPQVASRRWTTSPTVTSMPRAVAPFDHERAVLDEIDGPTLDGAGGQLGSDIAARASRSRSRGDRAARPGAGLDSVASNRSSRVSSTTTRAHRSTSAPRRSRRGGGGGQVVGEPVGPREVHPHPEDHRGGLVGAAGVELTQQSAELSVGAAGATRSLGHFRPTSTAAEPRRSCRPRRPRGRWARGGPSAGGERRSDEHAHQQRRTGRCLPRTVEAAPSGGLVVGHEGLFGLAAPAAAASRSVLVEPVSLDPSNVGETGPGQRRSGTVDVHSATIGRVFQGADRQPWRDRASGSSGPARNSASRPSPSTPTSTATRCTCDSPTRPSPSAARPQPRATSTSTSCSTRSSAPAPTRCTPGTGSSRRTATSPGP